MQGQDPGEGPAHASSQDRHFWALAWTELPLRVQALEWNQPGRMTVDPGSRGGLDFAEPHAPLWNTGLLEEFRPTQVHAAPYASPPALCWLFLKLMLSSDPEKFKGTRRFPVSSQWALSFLMFKF